MVAGARAEKVCYVFGRVICKRFTRHNDNVAIGVRSCEFNHITLTTLIVAIHLIIIFFSAIVAMKPWVGIKAY